MHLEVRGGTFTACNYFSLCTRQLSFPSLDYVCQCHLVQIIFLLENSFSFAGDFFFDFWLDITYFHMQPMNRWPLHQKLMILYVYRIHIYYNGTICWWFFKYSLLVMSGGENSYFTNVLELFFELHWNRFSIVSIKKCIFGSTLKKLERTLGEKKKAKLNLNRSF